MAVNTTINRLRAQVAQLELDNRDLRDQITRRAEEVKILRDKLTIVERANSHLQQRHTEHAAVLQGDRDVLTRALEVCTRRLASPIADKDPVRAGWRAANVLQASALNEKAEPQR